MKKTDDKPYRPPVDDAGKMFIKAFAAVVAAGTIILYLGQLDYERRMEGKKNPKRMEQTVPQNDSHQKLKAAPDSSRQVPGKRKETGSLGKAYALLPVEIKELRENEQAFRHFARNTQGSLAHMASNRGGRNLARSRLA